MGEYVTVCVCLCACVFDCVCLCTCVCLCDCVCDCVYLCTCVRVRVCVRAYVCKGLCVVSIFGRERCGNNVFFCENKDGKVGQREEEKGKSD